MFAPEMRAQFSRLKTLIGDVPAGLQGSKGEPGSQGPQGERGPQGGVSPLQLEDAIATTARNPSAIGPFSGSFSHPPTQAELYAFATSVDSLRIALQR